MINPYHIRLLSSTATEQLICIITDSIINNYTAGTVAAINRSNVKISESDDDDFATVHSNAPTEALALCEVWVKGTWVIN